MNHLITEKSAYLQAHAHQPIDWYPWGEEAFQKAWNEDKPILISIGYNSCHWCHVMARECFEDREVARLMNTYFVCIKVDREERPDVDQLYMDAVLLSRKQGGWPLNCFALPDGRPFYGLTYMPKKQWIALVERIGKLYRERPEEVREMARQLSQAMQQLDRAFLEEITPQPTRVQLPWEEVFKHLLQDIDWLWGGEWSSQKFPTPSRWLFSLRAGTLLDKPELVRAVHLTLEKMALGAIFDPIEGGFMRYATDRFWRVPHFEKMLYDNGLLLALYSEAYRHTPNSLYETVIRKTADFLLNKMQLSDGLFAASLSAESEGQEGLYYSWAYEELQAALPESDLAHVFFTAHPVAPEGNWDEGRNLLYRELNDTELAHRLGASVEAVQQQLEAAYQKLAEVRARRTPPPRDEAAILAWNAYVILGLVQAYKALGDSKHLYAARAAAHTLLESYGSELHRIHKEDRWYGEAFAEDYAAFTVALIHLYMVTGTDAYLLQAHSLMQRGLDLFYDSNEKVFCFTAKNLRFYPTRRKDIFDTSTPSSNSLFAESLWYLSRYFQLPDYEEKVLYILSRLRRQMAENPTLAGHFLQVALLEECAPFGVFYRGSDIQPLWRRYEPAISWVGHIAEPETHIPALRSYATYPPEKWFLCTYGACLPPVDTIDQLWSLVDGQKAALSKPNAEAN